MTITVDVATESIRTDTSSPYTYTHTGAASSGIKGVVVCIMHGTSATDHVSAVSYGGTALTRVVRASCSTAEPGAAEVWFLGNSVPQGGGDKTVSVTCGSTTDDIHVVTVTLLGSYDLEVVSTGTAPVTVGSNPSVALTSWSRSGMAFAAGYSGVTAQTSVSAGTNCSKVGTGELTGNFCSYVIRQTTAATGDFTIAATIASDDRAFAAAMVTEASPVVPGNGSVDYTGEAALVFRVLIQPPSGRVWLTTVGQSEPPSGTVTLTGYAPTVTVSSGGGVTITPSAGSVAYTGNAPTLSATANYVIAPTTGTVTYTGAAPSLALKITPTVGSVAYSGNAPTVTISVNTAITPTVGSVAYSGNAPRLALAIPPTTGTVTLTGAAPTLTFNASIAPTTGTIAYTGNAPALNLSVQAAAGTVTITGYAPTVTVSSASSIAPSTGTVSLTGYAPAVSLQLNVTITPTAGVVILTTFGQSPQVQPTVGSVALTGYAPNVISPITIQPAAGTVTYTGAAPTVSAGASRTITPTTGDLTLTGYVSPQVYTLPAPVTGTLSLAGYAPTVTRSSGTTIQPSAGTVTYTGSAPALAYKLTAQVGTVTYTGYAPTVTVTAAGTIIPTAGMLTLSGNAPTVTTSAHQVIQPATGAISLNGLAPSLGSAVAPSAGSLLISGTAPALGLTIAPSNGTVNLSGFAPVLAETNTTISPSSGTIAFTGSKPAVTAPPQVPERDTHGGAGYPVDWQGKRRKARLEERPNLHLRAILDDVVRELYGDLTEADVPAEVQKKAAKLVKPYAEKKAKKLAVPPESAVDWAALEKDAARVRQIVALWREEETRREIDDEDEFMLLVD